MGSSRQLGASRYNLLEVSEEALLNLRFHHSRILRHEEKLKLVVVLSIDAHYSLLEGALLVLPHHEPVHSQRCEVDQVDRLAVPQEKAREAAIVVVWKGDEISGLCFISQGALNLDERSLPLVDESDPGDTPASHSELVRRYLEDLSHQVVR